MDILLQNIHYSYGVQPVICAVSCSFSSGGVHVILGPNGSGKTTLLDLISGFSTPDQGKVLIDNQPVAQLSKKEIARRMAAVSQSYDVQFPFSVKEVVLMGRHPYLGRFSQPDAQDLALAEEAMKRSGILHLRNARITEVSGGEKQRCVLARALCQDTPILLLDEAFSNLDINHTIHMMQALKQLALISGKTIVAVLHDINLAAGWADTILFLKEGKVIVQAPTDKALTESNIRQVFDIDVKVEFNDFTQSNQVFFRAYDA